MANKTDTEATANMNVTKIIALAMLWDGKVPCKELEDARDNASDAEQATAVFMLRKAGKRKVASLLVNKLGYVEPDLTKEAPKPGDTVSATINPKNKAAIVSVRHYLESGMLKDGADVSVDYQDDQIIIRFSWRIKAARD